jgi:hypothetical protein
MGGFLLGAHILGLSWGLSGNAFVSPSYLCASEQAYGWALASHASSTETISEISQRRSVTPAAMAGVVLSVLMNADKVVREEMQRHRVSVVFHLLWKRIRQARHAARVHPHIEIVALRIGCADVRHIGVALNSGLDSASAFGRAVAERIKANQTETLPSPNGTWQEQRTNI